MAKYNVAPRIKKFKKVPMDLTIFVRDHTDWNRALLVLQDLAFGGKTVTNGNEKTFITEPDVVALRELIRIAYPKSDGESVEAKETAKEKVKQLSSPPEPYILGKTG